MKTIIVKTIFAITALIVMASSAAAEDADWLSWDSNNTLLHIPLTGFMALDAMQTVSAAKEKYDSGRYKYEEQNPILGKHPKEHAVWQYFAASYAVTTTLVYVLPERWSHVFQAGVIGLEVYCVDNNYRVGVKISF